jgi:RNA polymerase sigma factor (sigma-70 family)
MNVSELLHRFAHDRSEEVFSELMRRYVNLVYSVASRRLNDSTQVEEVVQDVFIRLARMDKPPTSEAELVGWLHASAHRVSIDRWRKDSRRQDREMKASEMIHSEALPSPRGTTWHPFWMTRLQNSILSNATPFSFVTSTISHSMRLLRRSV